MASLTTREALTFPARASDARSAVGRHMAAIGFVTAATSGTHSIREVCVLLVSNSGLRLSVFCVAAGQHTRGGMPTEVDIDFVRVPDEEEGQGKRASREAMRRKETTKVRLVA